MRCSAEGLALIQRFEGFSATPYLCPAGVWTIGYGHVLRGESRIGGEAPKITRGEAEALLLMDVEDAQQAVDRLIPRALTQGQYDALVSFTFNLGAAALQRSTLRQVVLRGEHSGAAAQFLRWVYAGGRVLPGLVARRRAEAARYGE